MSEKVNVVNVLNAFKEKEGGVLLLSGRAKTGRTTALKSMVSLLVEEGKKVSTLEVSPVKDASLDEILKKEFLDTSSENAPKQSDFVVIDDINTKGLKEGEFFKALFNVSENSKTKTIAVVSLKELDAAEKFIRDNDMVVNF